MSDQTCSACDNPVRDAFICNRCTRQTRHHLADQAAHHGELITALTRMVKMNAANDGGKAASRALGWTTMGDRFLADITDKELRALVSSLPPARPAADAMHSQRSLLVSWCRLLNDEGIATGLPANTIPAMACFIEVRLQDLRKHECAGELVHELRELHKQIMRAIDTPENRTKVHVGPCPATWVEGIEGGGQETVYCQGQIDAIFPRDEEQRPVIKCESCRSEWTPEHWSKIGDTISQRKRTDELLERAIYGSANWQTVQHAAKMLGVSERKIRHGVERHLVRHKVVGGGKKRRWYLVDWDDAADWASREAG